jgi:hypothetical protein
VNCLKCDHLRPDSRKQNQALAGTLKTVVRCVGTVLDIGYVSADPTVESESSPQAAFGVGDYGFGLIHLAWYRADQARLLMFRVR